MRKEEKKRIIELIEVKTYFVDNKQYNNIKVKELTYSMPTIKQRFTVILEKEDNGYVSLCPELDIASQGDSIEEAKDNLKEAIELFLEFASPSEIKNRQ